MVKIGERVGAIISAKDGVVRFAGYGTLVGYEDIEIDGLEINNPKIVLDSGESIYGIECWWGSEDMIKMNIQSYDALEYVDIKKIRTQNIKKAK